MDHGELLNQRLIGHRVASIRNALGIPPDVAADFALKKRRWIYYLEKGDAVLDIKSLNGLAIGFGVSPSVILGLEPIPTKLQVRRRDFFRTVGGATAAVLLNNLPSGQPSSRTARPDDVVQALGNGIAGAWSLFQTVDTHVIGTIAQSQLVILDQFKSSLQESGALPSLFSATHRLIGATHHRHGRYTEALQWHGRAYREALESGDVWNMVESRTWQAYGKKALGRHAESLQALESALQLITSWDEPRSIRTRARLLSSAAQDAAFLHDGAQASARLYESEALLDQITEPTDEFDRQAWLESSGICALFLGQLNLAITRLEQASRERPANRVARQVITSTALAAAFARAGDPEAARRTSSKIVPMLTAVKSAELNDYFLGFLHHDLLKRFPGPSYQAFVADTERSLLDHA
ncbi:MAG: hypothetical protein M3075_02825 [Candidatus Dormibacteraeota bacterium]|nr:hypothetical protein [Candidatus Dormibacteraeota bacterium]